MIIMILSILWKWDEKLQNLPELLHVKFEAVNVIIFI